MSVLYLEPRTDKQKRIERMLGVVGVGVLALVTTWVFANDQGEPAKAEAPASCKWEDEVLLRVEGDAFDLSDGDLVCLHIDIVGDAEKAR